jgi:hypothetical protein
MPGCGGAVLNALQNLSTEFGPQHLLTTRILLIPAGGYSQRQPNGAALGKVFTLLPLKSTTGRVQTMLHYKLSTYNHLASRMCPGVFVCAADALEYYMLDDMDEWTMSNDGVTVLAHPSSVSIALSHGVYVLENVVHTDRVCACVRDTFIRTHVGIHVACASSVTKAE